MLLLFSDIKYLLTEWLVGPVSAVHPVTKSERQCGHVYV